jgi:hypothetical protein
MTKFEFKNAPQGWSYPFSKKEIRTFLGGINANVQHVLFQGTKKPYEFQENVVDCWFGILRSQRINDDWSFYLELHCLKNEYVTPWKSQIIDKIFTEMRLWITMKQNLLSTAPEKPRSMFIGYKIVNDTFEVNCNEIN